MPDPGRSKRGDLGVGMVSGGWKDHPVISLAGIFGAGVAFALTVAVPIYNTSAKNDYDTQLQERDDKLRLIEDKHDDKLKLIEERYARYKADIVNIEALRKENVFWRRQLAEARVEVWQLSGQKPFRAGSPVPVGLEDIQKGRSIDDVKALLPKSEITFFKPFMFVNFNGVLFKSIQIRLAKGRIADVVYYVDDTTKAKQGLIAAMTATFGPYVKKTFDDDGEPMLHWKIGQKEIIVFRHQYSIFD